MIGNNGINQGQNIKQYQFITDNDKSQYGPIVHSKSQAE